MTESKMIDPFLPKNQLASPRRIDYLTTLREQRNLPFKDYSLSSPEEVEQEIQTIKSYRPASQLQIKTINQITERLNNMGAHVRPLDEEDIARLTGGKDGSAYEYIQKLIEMEEEVKLEQPLAKDQAEYISQMLYCPDIDWNAYDVNDRLTFDDGTYRIMSKEEFERELTSKLKKKHVNEFIYKYQTVYNAWKQTRIRPNQEETIRRYEKFLSSLEFKRERLVSCGIDFDEKPKKSLRKVYDPISHVPLQDFQLKQFSKEHASAYIQQLKYEIQAKRLYIFNKERNKDDDFEKLRNVNSTSEWATRELRTLHSMIYSLQKESGVVNEKITHLIPYQDQYTKASKDDTFFTDTKKHALIVDYMYYIVANHAITFNDLRIKCQRSSLAMKFLEATKNKLLNDRRFMESLLYK